MEHFLYEILVSFQCFIHVYRNNLFLPVHRLWAACESFFLPTLVNHAINPFKFFLDKIALKNIMNLRRKHSFPWT